MNLEFYVFFLEVRNAFDEARASVSLTVLLASLISSLLSHDNFPTFRVRLLSVSHLDALSECDRNILSSRLRLSISSRLQFDCVYASIVTNETARESDEHAACNGATYT